MISVKFRHQRIVQTTLNALILLISITVPATIFSIVLMHSSWWQSLNSVSFLAWPKDRFFSGVLASVVILFFAFTFSQTVIRNIFDNISSYYYCFSLNKFESNNRILDLVFLFARRFFDYSASFISLYLILQLILAPFTMFSVVSLILFELIVYLIIRNA